MTQRSFLFFLGVMAIVVGVIATFLIGMLVTLIGVKFGVIGASWGVIFVGVVGLEVILYYLFVLIAKVNELDRKLDQLQKSKVESSL